MKKLIVALILGIVLAVCGVAAAEEYILTPGDNLRIYVRGNERDFVIRPDGKIDFPLVGVIDTTDKTVSEFTEELRQKLDEYYVNPLVSVNITKLGSTRVFVFGEVRKQGMFALTKSHRVLDALGAAEGFTELAAKKHIYLIRNGQNDSIQKININNYLRKGDMSQNLVLREGDCLYLTGNHKLTLLDILNVANKAMSAWYYERRAEKY